MPNHYERFNSGDGNLTRRIKEQTISEGYDYYIVKEKRKGEYSRTVGYMAPNWIIDGERKKLQQEEEERQRRDKSRGIVHEVAHHLYPKIPDSFLRTWLWHMPTNIVDMSPNEQVAYLQKWIRDRLSWCWWCYSEEHSYPGMHGPIYDRKGYNSAMPDNVYDAIIQSWSLGGEQK